jgi:hypothetical protein
MAGPLEYKWIVKSDAERYVMGEVSLPAAQDTDDEFMFDDAIRRQAHRFLMKGYTDRIDRLHDRQVSGNQIAESFIVRGDNDPDGFRRGAWVVGAYITNDDDWAKVQKGEFNGWSWYGDAVIQKDIFEVDHPLQMVGDTEPWPVVKDEGSSQHTHKIDLKFDDAGRVIAGPTGPGPDGHVHLVSKTTATLPTQDHSHRIVVE